jgi:hypothetical protein
VLNQLNTDALARSQLSQKYDRFGEIKTFSQKLYLKSGEFIGYLTIDSDPVAASIGFYDRSLLVLVSGLTRNILLAFILIFVFLSNNHQKGDCYW